MPANVNVKPESGKRVIRKIRTGEFTYECEKEKVFYHDNMLHGIAAWMRRTSCKCSPDRHRGWRPNQETEAEQPEEESGLKGKGKTPEKS